MNAGMCVKTGVWWRERYSATVRTGDLFRLGWHWQIRGVPAGVCTVDVARVQVIVSMGALVERAGTIYHDTTCDVRLIAVSDEFRTHVEQWYAGCDIMLPAERVEDGRV